MPQQRTSKKASYLLEDADIYIAELKRFQRMSSDLIKFLELAKSVAASSLTQREK